MTILKFRAAAEKFVEAAFTEPADAEKRLEALKGSLPESHARAKELFKTSQKRALTRAEKEQLAMHVLALYGLRQFLSEKRRNDKGTLKLIESSLGELKPPED